MTGCDYLAYRHVDQFQHATQETRQGWIPGILPPSTHSISYRRDLEFLQAEGRFEFDPLETEYLTEHGASFYQSPRFQKDSPQNALLQQGYEFYRYSSSLGTYLIAVKRGRGYYWMAVEPSLIHEKTLWR